MNFHLWDVPISFCMNLKVKSIKQIFCIFLSIFIFLFSGFPSWAGETESQGNPPLLLAKSEQRIPDAKDLGTFMEEFWSKFKRANIPGMVFAVVKDGKIVFSQGYGYADREAKLPVNPEKTLFRLGSISKVFTTTAVMELVEQGKLDLKADVNQYLKSFQIDNKNFPPITLHHLLTHTDGFDVAWTIGAATHCNSAMPSLGEFLSQNLPKRVRQPGELYVYGDVGMALAGYLVEVVSGLPFTEYIDKNILQPLEMQHSSFAQPLSGELAKDLAVGYDYRNGAYLKTPFVCGKSSPTIGMSATATDMADFLISQFQGEKDGKGRILAEKTLSQMQQQHFTNFPNHDGMSGSAYGWYERFQNNQRALEHGGSMYGYSSQIFILPEHNLGFFFAANSEDKTQLRENLIAEFLNRYYPEAKSAKSLPQPQITPESQQRLKEIEGSYRFIRYPQDSLVKLFNIWFGPRPDMELKANNDGTISFLPKGSKWVEVEPWLLRYKDTNNYLGFRRDDRGKVTTTSLSNYVFVTYEKLAWYETGKFQKVIFGFCLVIFLSAGWVWPINRLVFPKASYGKMTRILQLLLGLIGGLNLLFVGAMLSVMIQVSYWEFFFGMPPLVIGLLYLPIVTMGMTTGLPIVAWLAWRDKSWSIRERIHYGLIGIAAGFFIFLLSYWNLLGVRG